MKLNGTKRNTFFEQLGRHLELVVGAFCPTENFGLNFQEWNTLSTIFEEKKKREQPREAINNRHSLVVSPVILNRNLKWEL